MSKLAQGSSKLPVLPPDKPPPSPRDAPVAFGELPLSTSTTTPTTSSGAISMDSEDVVTPHPNTNENASLSSLHRKVDTERQGSHTIQTTATSVSEVLSSASGTKDNDAPRVPDQESRTTVSHASIVERRQYGSSTSSASNMSNFKRPESIIVPGEDEPRVFYPLVESTVALNLGDESDEESSLKSTMNIGKPMSVQPSTVISNSSAANLSIHQSSDFKRPIDSLSANPDLQTASNKNQSDLAIQSNPTLGQHVRNEFERSGDVPEELNSVINKSSEEANGQSKVSSDVSRVSQFRASDLNAGNAKQSDGNESSNSGSGSPRKASMSNLAASMLRKLSTTALKDSTTNNAKPFGAPDATSLGQAPETFDTSSVRVTTKTKLSDLSNVPIETVASLGGWTAKRVSITGQIYFERDADGRIQLDRPREALDAVRQSKEDDESDGDEDIISRREPDPQAVPGLSPPPSTKSAHQSTEKPMPLNGDLLAAIQAAEANDRCIDCGSSGPSWASVSFGVLICMGCSAVHRSFGSHITAVKSLTLDNWTAEQIAFLHPHGGNARFKQHVKLEGKPSARYTTDDASLYRIKLKALVRNEPIPSDKAVAAILMSDSVRGLSPPPSPARARAKNAQETREVTTCQLCGRGFSVVVRKHVCRNCNRVACARCAPAANTKPLPHLGLGMSPQRHCSRCYRSPFIDWSTLGLSSAEQAAEAEVAADTAGTAMRRKTIGDRKVRRKTVGDAIAGMLKRG